MASSRGKNKRLPSPRLVDISEIQLRMLDGYFEGKNLNRYGSYDAPGSKYKYIHCDLTDANGLHTITLSASEGHAHALSSKLNVGMCIRVSNFSVFHKQGAWEFGDHPYSLRVGAMTSVEHIADMPILLSFISTHTIGEFLRRGNLSEVGTLEMVVIGVHGRSRKQFILAVADDASTATSFVFYPEFYAEYKELSDKYSRGEVATFQVKNATSATHGENCLTTSYPSIFVLPVPKPEVASKLKVVYQVHTFETKTISQTEVIGRLSVPQGAAIFEDTCSRCHLPTITKRDQGSYCFNCKCMVEISADPRIVSKIIGHNSEVWECTLSGKWISIILKCELRTLTDFKAFQGRYLRKLSEARPEGVFTLNASAKVVGFSPQSLEISAAMSNYINDSDVAGMNLDEDVGLFQPNAIQNPIILDGPTPLQSESGVCLRELSPVTPKEDLELEKDLEN